MCSNPCSSRQARKERERGREGGQRGRRGPVGESEGERQRWRERGGRQQGRRPWRGGTCFSVVLSGQLQFLLNQTFSLYRVLYKSCKACYSLLLCDPFLHVLPFYHKAYISHFCLQFFEAYLWLFDWLTAAWNVEKNALKLVTHDAKYMKLIANNIYKRFYDKTVEQNTVKSSSLTDNIWLLPFSFPRHKTHLLVKKLKAKTRATWKRRRRKKQLTIQPPQQRRKTYRRMAKRRQNKQQSKTQRSKKRNQVKTKKET